MGRGKKNLVIQVEKHWTFEVTGNCKKTSKNVFLYISEILVKLINFKAASKVEFLHNRSK
jgi:hypothetical protein